MVKKNLNFCASCNTNHFVTTCRSNVTSGSGAISFVNLDTGFLVLAREIMDDFPCGSIVTLRACQSEISICLFSMATSSALDDSFKLELSLRHLSRDCFDLEITSSSVSFIYLKF